MTFEQFLDAELDGLGRFAQVLTGDRQQAHDTLAESLIKVHAHWRRISVMDRPVPYVRRIITNTFLQDRRSWVNRMSQSMAPEDLPQLGISNPADRVDDRSQLHDLLGSLPRQQRTAIVLRHYLDLTDAEIAVSLHCSEGAVRSYISRGFAALRLNTRVEPPAVAVPPRSSRRPNPTTVPTVVVVPSMEER